MCATTKTNAPEIDRKFILAGHAIFTVANPKGEHYTYQVRKVKFDNGIVKYFADVLTGSNNESDYSYGGVIEEAFLKFRLTPASKFSDDSKAVKVLRWALGIIFHGESLPEGYRVHHEGYCGRCGALLTVTGSVDAGYGPKCAKLMGITAKAKEVEKTDLELKMEFQALEIKQEATAFMSKMDRGPFALTNEECAKIGAVSHC